MGKGVVVDGMPIAADERADEQKEGRLRLVEISDQLVHDVEGVAGFDHDLGLGMERLLMRSIEVVEDGLQGLRS